MGPRLYLDNGVVTKIRPRHSRAPATRIEKQQVIERVIYREPQSIDPNKVASLIRESMEDDVRRAAVKAFMELLRQFKRHLPTGTIPIPSESFLGHPRSSEGYSASHSRTVKIDDRDLRIPRDTGLSPSTISGEKITTSSDDKALQELKELGIK